MYYEKAGKPRGPLGRQDDRTHQSTIPGAPHTTRAAAGGSDQRALILGEILEVRTHLTNPAAVSATDEPRSLAAACYALPGYARELNRQGTPRLWPYASGYAEGRRRDELLLAIGYLIAAFEDHTLDNKGVLLNRAAIIANLPAAGRAGRADPG
jgi:hypothetical protein